MKENTVPNITPEEGKKKLTLLDRMLAFRKPHYPAKPSPEEAREEAEEEKRNFVEPTSHHPSTAADAKGEPAVGEVSPVQESVPFEEERRSYERRKPSAVPWLAEERRKRDRRRAEPVAMRSEKKEAAPPQRNRLRNFLIFTAALALVGGVAYRLLN